MTLMQNPQKYDKIQLTRRAKAAHDWLIDIEITYRRFNELDRPAALRPGMVDWKNGAESQEPSPWTPYCLVNLRETLHFQKSLASSNTDPAQDARDAIWNAAAAAVPMEVEHESEGVTGGLALAPPAPRQWQKPPEQATTAMLLLCPSQQRWLHRLLILALTRTFRT